MKEIIELSQKSVVLKRNEYLKTYGTIDTNIYHVESGSLKIFVMNDEQEQIIRFGYTGNIIVALDSYISKSPSEFFIQAIKKTKVNIITRQQMNSFLAEEENNKTLWISILENLILQMNEREKDILTVSPKERYERVLKRSPQLFQEIPNRYIANYLRMSPETLSRLKKS